MTTNAVGPRPRASSYIDRHVGLKIRERRVILGLTQEQLAQMIRVSSGQAQKYETGATRLTAGQLFRVALALDVGISYFFEGIELDKSAEPPERQRMKLDLVRSVADLRSRRVQQTIADLVRALAEQGPGAPEAEEAGSSEG